MLRQGKIQESLTFGHFWKKLVYFVVFDVWKPFEIDDFCQKQDMKFLMKFRLILPLENSLTISKIYNLFTVWWNINEFLQEENLWHVWAESHRESAETLQKSKNVSRVCNKQTILRQSLQLQNNKIVIFSLTPMDRSCLPKFRE